ncbi:hypothetical protein ATANTOWER_020854 [Ataeniobius toweri]|uniref:Uncharacterized protein n=1 Tax=Ataeniobius toweri TaxID=208326 RepID=A0ABU7AGA9_9TELE|nr:hypothetical protein [Ataeniobius toweri]
MGTLLSLSPSSRSTAAPLKKKLVVRKLLEVPDDREEKKKRYSGLMHALHYKKRLMALGSKKKVDLQAASEGPNTGHKIRHRSIHVAGPTIQEKEMCIRRVVVQVSTVGGDIEGHQFHPPKLINLGLSLLTAKVTDPYKEVRKKLIY